MTETLAELASTAPVPARVLVGLVGAVLVVAGARWYHWGLALAAFATGAALAVSGLMWLSAWVPVAGEPMVTMVGAGMAGVVALGTARMAHKVAMLIAGALTGLVAAAALVSALAAPAWGALVGMVVGALLFPWVYQQLLKVVTPAVGAACLAWALGRPDSVILLGVIWVFGVVVQTFAGGPAAEDDDG